MAAKSGRRPPSTASNKLLWPVLEILSARGTDVAETLAAVGLDEDRATAPDGRIQLDQLFAIWRTAAAITEDGAIGIRAAGFSAPFSNRSWPMPLALFEEIGRLSSNLAEAIALQDRFGRLLYDGMHSALELEDARGVFRIDCVPDQPPSLVEFNFAVALNIARRVLVRDVVPHAVWFAHPGPADPSAHERFFRTRVRWNAPFDALIGAARLFLEPLPTAHERHRARVIRQADQLLSALPDLERFEAKVCAQIEAELPDGNTNAAAVAEKLGVSSRTLHRRLQNEGASYQELLDRIRCRLAVRHLSSGKPIARVAGLVGFAQPSTFHRAFKSWTRETPAEYQARIRPGGGPPPDALPLLEP